MSYDFKSPRLFLRAGLQSGTRIEADRAQANYLLNVLRLGASDSILVFNGRDGEWRARIEPAGRKACVLAVAEQVRPPSPAPDLHYLFAPLKHARLDYMVQKAVELGASKLQPVLTRYTQAQRVNLERMRANAIEAAQQCGVLTIPEIGEATDMPAALGRLEPPRTLIFCDEEADVADPVAALEKIRTPPSALLPADTPSAQPLAVLIGPEGGFAPEERELLLARPNTIRLALGPRILRADTAAVAALTLVQAVLGDWRS